MQRLGTLTIIVVGLLHMHCACGALEVPLALLSQASSDEAEPHSHPSGQELCAADDRTAPHRETLGAPERVLLTHAPPSTQDPTPAPAFAVAEPGVTLLVFRLISSQPPRAPPTS